jgi:hypothetical protein
LVEPRKTAPVPTQAEPDPPWRLGVEKVPRAEPFERVELREGSLKKDA